MIGREEIQNKSSPGSVTNSPDPITSSSDPDTHSPVPVTSSSGPVTSSPGLVAHLPSPVTSLPGSSYVSVEFKSIARNCSGIFYYSRFESWCYNIVPWFRECQWFMIIMRIFTESALLLGVRRIKVEFHLSVWLQEREQEQWWKLTLISTLVVARKYYGKRAPVCPFLRWL